MYSDGDVCDLRFQNAGERKWDPLSSLSPSLFSFTLIIRDQSIEPPAAHLHDTTCVISSWFAIDLRLTSSVFWLNKNLLISPYCSLLRKLLSAIAGWSGKRAALLWRWNFWYPQRRQVHRFTRPSRFGFLPSFSLASFHPLNGTQSGFNTDSSSLHSGSS